MELGEKLRLARQAAGLSQRQLCGDVITRNMLSQIEHGTAKPSMATLQYLASRLEKPVSFFLEEGLEVSPNQRLMAHARRACAEGNWEEARLVLTGFQQPDALFETEYRYRYGDATLHCAQSAIQSEKIIYARELLTDASALTEPFPELERRRILLLGSIAKHDLADLCRLLPNLDEELFLRARGALEEAQWDRGLALLDAMERQDTPDRYLLQGRLLMGKKAYEAAATQLEKAEGAYPVETVPLLEHCYRELGDYKLAYQYACKQRAR